MYEDASTNRIEKSPMATATFWQYDTNARQFYEISIDMQT